MKAMPRPISAATARLSTAPVPACWMMPGTITYTDAAGVTAETVRSRAPVTFIWRLSTRGFASSMDLSPGAALVCLVRACKPGNTAGGPQGEDEKEGGERQDRQAAEVLRRMMAVRRRAEHPALQRHQAMLEDEQDQEQRHERAVTKRDRQHRQAERQLGRALPTENADDNVARRAELEACDGLRPAVGQEAVDQGRADGKQRRQPEKPGRRARAGVLIVRRRRQHHDRSSLQADRRLLAQAA